MTAERGRDGPEDFKGMDLESTTEGGGKQGGAKGGTGAN